MIRDLLNKASHSAKAARALLEGDAPDDAVSRAYYSAFNTARALIASKEPDAAAKTHGPTLSAFSRLFVKPGLLPKHYGEMINRLQRARQIADYENAGLDRDDAERYATFAEELYEKALGLLPAAEHPPSVKKSPQEILIEAKKEEAAKHALASAFCALAAKRGEVIHAGLVDELVLYGTESSLTELIAEIDEMNDLASFVKARVPVPSFD
jgi:uncharacterized protein (UPF0332 family)